MYPQNIYKVKDIESEIITYNTRQYTHMRAGQ